MDYEELYLGGARKWSGTKFGLKGQLLNPPRYLYLSIIFG
jgi:hypothetical protein